MSFVNFLFSSIFPHDLSCGPSLAVLKKVLSEFNQHQVLAVTPFHSQLDLAVKKRLYSHIHAHMFILPGNKGCKFFHFSKYLINHKTKKFTLISVDNFKRCFDKMDGNWSATYLEMHRFYECSLKHIFDKFKRVRNFRLIGASTRRIGKKFGSFCTQYRKTSDGKIPAYQCKTSFENATIRQLELIEIYN